MADQINVIYDVSQGICVVNPDQFQRTNQLGQAEKNAERKTLFERLLR
jgi:hypothetical protein